MPDEGRIRQTPRPPWRQRRDAPPAEPSRAFGGLGGERLLHQAAHGEGRGIDVDVDGGRVGQGGGDALLRLHHRHVLEEDGAEVADDARVDRLVVDREVAALGIEHERGGRGLRRRGDEGVEAHEAVAVASQADRAGRREAGIDGAVAGQHRVGALPAIDAAGVIEILREQRHRRDVGDPARHAHAPRVSLGLDGKAVEPLAAERAAMDIDDMREVEEIVVVEFPVAFHVQRLATIADRDGEARVGELRPVGNEAVVGLGRVAHPDPQELPFLDQRKAPHPRAGRNGLLARDLDAGAAGIEQQAVIAAADGVALDPPQRQRQTAMAAAILERRGGPGLGAEQHHRHAGDDARQRRPPDLAAPGGDVPAIAEKHRTLPCPPRIGAMIRRSAGASI